MQANTIKFSAYKAEYFKNALVKAYEKDPKNYEENAKQILQIGNRHQITEYQTTIARARTARQFGNFQNDKDLYPNLEWLRTRSIAPRELHLSYVGLILPIDDPFWQENQPGNLYNCKCSWRQTNKPATAGPEKIVKPNPGLEGNPYTQREIFSEKHPYFGRADDKTSERIDNFVSEQIFEKQFKKQDGGYFVHPLQNKKASDYKDLSLIAGEFIKQGKKVFILPKLTESKGDLYKYVYKGAYYPKQPDLLIGGLFYEFESITVKYTSNKLGDMLSKAIKQSDRIIIDVRGSSDVSTRYIKKRIHDRIINEKQIINEVWILKDGDAIERIL